MLDKREDLFLNLAKNLKRWESGPGDADWNPSTLDIHDLRTISYDYIRFLINGKDFRSINIKSKKTGIFANRKPGNNLGIDMIMK